MTGLTLTAVCAICARSHHQVSSQEDTFTISHVVGYLMIGIGLLICSVPLWPGAAGDVSKVQFFWTFAPFWLGAFAAAAYFFRYRVIVGKDSLTCGAFLRSVVPFSEIIDFDVLQGRSSSELWVYLKSGKRLKFSGLLGDFDDLVDLVDDHLAEQPGGQHDSDQKLRDQANRVRDNRNDGWFSYIALGVVGLVLFVLWRMGLLH
jgi:hypothetical protein